MIFLNPPQSSGIPQSLMKSSNSVNQKHPIDGTDIKTNFSNNFTPSRITRVRAPSSSTFPIEQHAHDRAIIRSLHRTNVIFIIPTDRKHHDILRYTSVYPLNFLPNRTQYFDSRITWDHLNKYPIFTVDPKCVVFHFHEQDFCDNEFYFSRI